MIRDSAGGVVLNSKGQVLVVNQNNNSWSLPKGHLDPGENALTAAKREIYEESGVKKLTLVKKLGTYKRPRISLQGGNSKKEIKQITLFLFTTSYAKKLKPIDPTHPEARWIDQSKVADLLTHPKDKAFFLKILGQLKSVPKQGFIGYLSSPIGWLEVQGMKTIVSRISCLASPPKKNKKTLPGPIVKFIESYFKGKPPKKKIQFHLKGTPFQEKVWESLQRIPWGKCVSYSDIAKSIGKPRAIRAASSAVGKNPIAILVPCHRVIGSDGSLTGYAYGLKKKAWLLDHEKRHSIDLRINNRTLAGRFWAATASFVVGIVPAMPPSLSLSRSKILSSKFPIIYAKVNKNQKAKKA